MFDATYATRIFARADDDDVKPLDEEEEELDEEKETDEETEDEEEPSDDGDTKF